MKSYRVPLVVLVVSYLVFFAVLGATYGELPARVASHFDAAGRANGWMSRDGIVEFMVGSAVLVPGLIIGQMVLSSRIPARFMNIPNKDFWTTPEGRVRMKVIFIRSGLWFGSMMVLFLTGVHVLVLAANLGGGRQLNMSGLTVVTFCFLIGTAIWAIGMIRQFMRLPLGNSQNAPRSN